MHRTTQGTLEPAGLEGFHHNCTYPCVQEDADAAEGPDESLIISGGYLLSGGALGSNLQCPGIAAPI